MSVSNSELMMDLLKEMALLKQLDDVYEKGSKSDSENSEFDARPAARDRGTNEGTCRASILVAAEKTSPGPVLGRARL
jgi:hypothetical protein